MFSESFKLELSDVHFVFGPNRDEMSMDGHFHKDPETCEYDCNDQTPNIMLMHRIVHEVRRLEREFELELRMMEKLYRKKQRGQIRDHIQKKKTEVETLLEQKKSAPKQKPKPANP